MLENLNIDCILELKLHGAAAHFRKFYTNASSLSYGLPPRTAVAGLLASILQRPRDSYYEDLASNKLHIALAIAEDCNWRKQFFTMNYMNSSEGINNAAAHVQCRLELLLPAGSNKELTWILYVGYDSTAEGYLKLLAEKIAKQDLGYDIYLGQRQFRAGIELLNQYKTGDFKLVESSDYLDTAIDRKQVVTLENSEYDIAIERMPLEQRNEDIPLKAAKKAASERMAWEPPQEEENSNGLRRSIRFADILYEVNGKRLKGGFQSLIELNNPQQSRISFL